MGLNYKIVIVLVLVVLCLLAGCELQLSTSWNPNTTYSKSEAVPLNSNGTDVYSSLQDNNKGHNPPDSPNWWQRDGTIVIHFE